MQTATHQTPFIFLDRLEKNDINSRNETLHRSFDVFVFSCCGRMRCAAFAHRAPRWKYGVCWSFGCLSVWLTGWLRTNHSSPNARKFNDLNQARALSCSLDNFISPQRWLAASWICCLPIASSGNAIKSLAAPITPLAPFSKHLSFCPMSVGAVSLLLGDVASHYLCLMRYKIFANKFSTSTPNKLLFHLQCSIAHSFACLIFCSLCVIHTSSTKPFINLG